MSTILNPSTTPAPVYNREGRTIETVTAAGNSAANATPIVQYAQTTIIKVLQGPTGSAGVLLPAGSDEGSVVEMYADIGNTLQTHVFPASGETLIIQSASVPSNIIQDFMRFRKVSATEWYGFFA